jgi:hypothetical protein
MQDWYVDSKERVFATNTVVLVAEIDGTPGDTI